MNTNTMGVAMLGTFSSASPTQAARSSLEKLLAWKADQRGINPLQSSYHSPSQLTLNNISGHRDANPSPAPSACPKGTVCPGTTLYNLLPSTRTNVNTLITGGSKPDLVVLSLSGPSTGTIGSTINVSSQAANTGAADATSSFRMGFYLSTNSTISTSDTLIQTCNFPSGLPAGFGGTCRTRGCSWRANNTILLTAPGYYGSPGAVWVEPVLGTSGTVHVVIDVNGYFQ